VFLDEFGYSFAESLVTTWAPRGETPVIRRVGKYRREISTLAAITISGKLYQKHCMGYIDKHKVIEGLQHLRRQIQGQCILIMDRAPAHIANEVKLFLARQPDILVEWLPSYAPDINPEEYCHGNIKAHLANGTPEHVDAIRRQLDLGFARLRRRPDLLLTFFHHAGLRLKQLW
jgi:transposase